jgi:SAM-dependent methyltransferase
MDDSNQAFADFERAGWESASVVAKYDELLSAVTTQSVEAVLDAAGVGPGTRLLDVAAGAGYLAGAAVQRGADAVGIDFSIAQVRLARRRYPRIRFEQADAQALGFPEDTFDAVVCGFGICHLPDPDRALREAFRVLKRGGRVAFTVWDVPERAVGFGAVYGAIRDHGSVDVGLPDGPSLFLFSDPVQSSRALLAAGFVTPSCRPVPQTWRMTDPDELFATLAEGTVRAGAILRAQEAAALGRIRASVREAVARYRSGDLYQLPMPAALATAVKP